MMSYVAPSLADINNKDISVTVEKALKKAKETLTSLGMDVLLKKHSKWDNVTYTNLEDCDNMDSDEEDDGDDQQLDDGDDQKLDDVEPAVNKEIVSAIVKEVCEDDPAQVENDFRSICTLGIADPVVSDKLGKLSKCLAPVLYMLNKNTQGAKKSEASRKHQLVLIHTCD